MLQVITCIACSRQLQLNLIPFSSSFGGILV